MAAAVVLWLAGFDVLYACQDYAFDVAHGLFSVPRPASASAPPCGSPGGLHAGCVALLVCLWRTTPELGAVLRPSASGSRSS